MTAEDQYQANLLVLQRQANLAPLVANLFNYPLVNLQLLPGQNGELYGRVWDITTQQWVHLCNPEQPSGEADAAVQAMFSPQIKVYTIVGLGLGYVVASFAKRMLPYQRLVVWDADPGMFKAMLYAIDVAGIFEGKRIEVYVGEELPAHIEKWYLSLEVQEKLHLSFPLCQAYTDVYRNPEYAAIQAKCIEGLRHHAVGMSTWKQFGKCIGDNDLENMPEYFANPGYEHLEGLWKNKPAICAAAGPSLQKNLRHLLPDHVRSNIALITVGTVYALFQGLGLAPDVVTTIDFQRLNWTDQFQYLPLDPDCPLVYLHSTYPQTVRRWPGPKFVAENASDTVGWLRQFGEGKKQAAQVQTVAHLNLLVALELGANPIILMGQDLSMPMDAHHAAGARAQDAAPNEVAPEAFITLPDFEGTPTQTRHSFLSMLQVFERIIAEHPETTFLNCSEQGLAIKGAANMPLSEVLAKYCSAEIPPEEVSLRQRIKARFRAYVPQTKPDMLEHFAGLRKQVGELGDWAQEIHASQRMLEEIDSFWHLTPDQQAALLASDCMSTHEYVDTCMDELRQAMLASEQIIKERPAAWGIFGIRRFDFVELMAEVPPPAEQVDTPQKQRAYNAARLVRVAQMIQEELGDVRLLLRRVEKRLVMSHAETHEDMPLWYYDTGSARAMAAQLYALSRKTNQRESQGTLASPNTITQTAMREYAQYLRHTQQYDAALALMDAWCFAPQHAARIRAHLACYRADVRAALPAYFGAKETTPSPMRTIMAADLSAIMSGTHLGLSGHISNTITPVPDELILAWHAKEQVCLPDQAATAVSPP